MKFLVAGKIATNKLILLILLLIILILLPLVIKSAYILGLFIVMYIAVVLGMSFSMQYSVGLISLGAAAPYAIGAYASTLLVVKQDLSFWAALPLSTIITGIIVLGIGLIIIRAGRFIFVLLTMLFVLAVEQLGGALPLLGGWTGFLNIPRPDPIPIPFHAPIEFVSRTPYYYLMLFLLLLIVLIFYALYSSRIGRAWQVIKQSPPLAETLGINIYRYRVLAFVIAAMASGAVGSFYAHYYQTITPTAFGGFASIYMQIYSALGGLDFYILGPAIGAAIMTFIPQLLTIAPEIQPIIFGALLIAIIAFFPGGIIGTLQRRGQVPAVYTRINRTIRGWLFGMTKPRG